MCLFETYLRVDNASVPTAVGRRGVALAIVDPHARLEVGVVIALGVRRGGSGCRCGARSARQTACRIARRSAGGRAIHRIGRSRRGACAVSGSRARGSAGRAIRRRRDRGARPSLRVLRCRGARNTVSTPWRALRSGVVRGGARRSRFLRADRRLRVCALGSRGGPGNAGAGPFLQHEEVVPVKMKRMRLRNGVSRGVIVSLRVSIAGRAKYSLKDDSHGINASVVDVRITDGTTSFVRQILQLLRTRTYGNWSALPSLVSSSIGSL